VPHSSWGFLHLRPAHPPPQAPQCFLMNSTRPPPSFLPRRFGFHTP
jgi:hypothetical protein